MEIFIENNRLNATFRIWLQEEKANGVNVNYTFDAEKKMVRQEWEGCAAEKLIPLIELPRREFYEMVRAVVEFNEKTGIHSEREDITKGRLIEKENHLNDIKQSNERLFELLKLSIEKM